MKVVLTGNTAFKLANFRMGLIAKLIKKGVTVCVVAPEDEYAQRLRDEGCEFYPISMDRQGINPFVEIILAYKILRIIRALKPDYVFSYTLKNNVYFGLACRILGVAFAPNVTGLGPVFDKKKQILRFFVVLGLRVSIRHSQMIFFQNSNDKAVYLNRGICVGDKSVVLPGSGVNITQFAYTPISENNNCVSFLMVARLIREKGVIEYFEAAKILKKAYPQVKFQLLGPVDSSSKASLPTSFISLLKNNDIVEYLGSRENVIPSMVEATCVVLPTFYNEGTPRTLLEAMSLGRPIITTRIPGCEELIDSGNNGRMCAPRDHVSLASQMEAFVLMSSEERELMGERASKFVSERYDEREVVKSYLDLLEPETPRNQASQEV